MHVHAKGHALSPTRSKPLTPRCEEEMASYMQSLTETVEANFTVDKVAEHLYAYLSVPPLLCVAYLLLVFSGRKWMSNKPAYDLRLPLTVWNSVLAAFSITGFLVMGPPIVEQVRNKWFVNSVCTSLIAERAWLSLWSLLFVYSKVIEFGDTFFIVLRKTPLNFLHWYHHVTVLLYSWHGLSTKNTAGHWFSGINFGVHAVMYSYYMFKAMGFKISASVAKAITIMQLAQFVVGLVVLFTGVWTRWMGNECGMNGTHLLTGVIMYGSYFILFLNFFYKRYVVPSPKREKKD